MALALILLGTFLRVLHAFPAYKFPGDADALGPGLRAFWILKGHTPVFYADARLGAFESYLHAAAFTLAGASRASMSLAPLVCGALGLVAFWFLIRSLLGEKLGALALLFLAFPSPAYIFWTYLPIGYVETMLF